MIRPARRTGLLVTLAFLAMATPAHAGPSAPPPPPTTPVCGYCKGPPPPPTLVPTAPPGVIPPTSPVISVKVSPAKVHRGHRVKLTIATVPETSLTVAVRYRTGKPTTYHGKTDGKGGASVRWTVPAAAALGKATAKVTAEVSGKSQLLSVTFTVLK